MLVAALHLFTVLPCSCGGNKQKCDSNLVLHFLLYILKIQMKYVCLGVLGNEGWCSYHSVMFDLQPSSPKLTRQGKQAEPVPAQCC